MLRSKEIRYAYWRDVMKQFEESNLSQEKYCEENKLSFRKFKYYRYHIQLENKKVIKKQTFAELQLEQPKLPSTKINNRICITFPSQLSVSFDEPIDYHQLVELVRALKQC